MTLRPPLITLIPKIDRDGVPTRAPDVNAGRLLNLLKSQDLFFTVPGDGPIYDWPNPNLGTPPPASRLSFTGTINFKLLGEDTFFAASGQGPTYDWPNPVLRKYTNDSGTWPVNLLTNTLKIVFPVPFSLEDWPNPRGPSYPISLLTHTQWVRVNLLGKDKFFGAAGEGPTYEWTVPRGRAPINDLGFWSVNLLQTRLAAAAATPFAQLDWQNPLLRQFPPQTMWSHESGGLFTPPAVVTVIEDGGIWIGDETLPYVAAAGDAGLAEAAGEAGLQTAAGDAGAITATGRGIKYRVNQPH